MGQAEEIRRDENQLLDESFRRMSDGAMPGDGTWDDWIERAESLSERWEAAGFPEAAEDLRQIINSTKTGHLDAEMERVIEREVKRAKGLAMLIISGLAVATIAIVGLVTAFIVSQVAVP